MAVLVMLALRLSSQTPSAFLTFGQSKPHLTDETAVSQWLAQGPQGSKSECHEREQASQGLNFLSLYRPRWCCLAFCQHHLCFWFLDLRLARLSGLGTDHT